MFADDQLLMTSNIWIWKNVSGLVKRYNDVLYTHPKCLPTKNILIYFGGDIQDIEEYMDKNVKKQKYKKWSLDNTTRMLSKNFPKYHIFVVRPSRISGVFSCFDNFVSCDEYGNPKFYPTYDALTHLQELVKSLLEKVMMLERESKKDAVVYKLDEVNLTLMGFSKGCIVLNQLLHEFYYFQFLSTTNIVVNTFINRIKNMWWLDGGHGGFKDTWITEQNILESFAKLQIHVHIHVTPYQIQDTHRPWIQVESHQFYTILQALRVPIQHTIHFENKPCNLLMHFNLLEVIKDLT